MWRKKTTNFSISIPISKTTSEIYKILSPFNENDNNYNLCKITFQIFQKLVNTGLGVDISFNQFL
jgi:hypothetical protein